MLVMSALMLPVMIVRFYMGVFQMVFIDLPLIIASFWSISAFYIVAYRELFPKHWKRSVFLLPMLMAVGIALTVVNTRAVMEALLGIRSAFVRTPKYAIEGAPMNLEHKKYRRKSGWLPYIEIAVGSYFLYMIFFAIDTYNYFAIPFLALFVAGYFWAAFATLYHEHQGQLALAARTARVRVGNGALSRAALTSYATELSPVMVREASLRIRPLARHTPVFSSTSINEVAGLDVHFKCENLQRGGSFKIRGASNLILSLPEEDLPRGVVAYSSGNHAQAVAIAAHHVGAPATIVMPADAPRIKMEPRAIRARASSLTTGRARAARPSPSRS